MSWPQFSLGDLGTFFGGVTSISKDDYGWGTPFLTYKNVYSNSKVDVSQLALMNVKPADIRKRNCVYGDIFFTASSETPDEVAMSSVLLDEVDGLTFNGFTKRFRLHDFSTLLPEFARYLFRGDLFRVAAYEAATGDVRYNISQESLARISVSLPPVEEQRCIARTLTALDDKIESNERAIVLQLSLITAEFARRFGERELALELSQLADVVDCLHTKKPAQTKSGPLLMQLNNIRDDGLVDRSFRFSISSDDYVKWSRKLETRPFDCVITNVGRIGAVARIPAGFSAALGRNMTGVRPRDVATDGSFLAAALLSAPVRREIELKTDAGTIMNALNVRNIPLLRLPQSTSEERRSFHRWASPLYAKADQLHVESCALGATRDSLLPPLLSGRMRVAGTAGVPA